MPRAMQEFFWKVKFPDPAVEFDDTLVATRKTWPEFDVLRMAVMRNLDVAVIDIVGVNGPVKVRTADFFGVVLTCQKGVQWTRKPNLDPATERFCREAGPILEQCYKDGLYPAIVAIYNAVNIPLQGFSRLDERILVADLVMDNNESGKLQPRFIITSHPPETRDITIDNITRPMYRVGTGAPSGRVQWLTISRDKLGVSTKSGPIDVYVQRHALMRLHTRLNLPPAAPFLEAWLEQSLANPKVVARRGQHLMIEYRIREHRLGYLIAFYTKKYLAVRTFKFLTMKSTPEGRRLEKRLKISRQGVNHLKLHTLNAFTQTDVRDDPELRWLLTKSGCGHLFELDPSCYPPEPKPFAMEIRAYRRAAA